MEKLPQLPFTGFIIVISFVLIFPAFFVVVVIVPVLLKPTSITATLDLRIYLLKHNILALLA